MSKPIAILSSNPNKTLEWAKEHLKIGTINFSNRWLKDKQGQEYYIVSIPDEVYGFEFGGYIKAPDFETLEDIIKTRIR